MSDDIKQTGRVRFSRAFWIVVTAILSGVIVVVAYPHSRPICKVRLIDVQTANILAAIKTYRAELGTFPGENNGTISRALRGQNDRKTPFLDCSESSISATGELLDPWGTPFRFYRSGDEIAIRSAGPNRRFDSSAEPDCDDYFR